jgi:hypothetical protein
VLTAAPGRHHLPSPAMSTDAASGAADKSVQVKLVLLGERFLSSVPGVFLRLCVRSQAKLPLGNRPSCSALCVHPWVLVCMGADRGRGCRSRMTSRRTRSPRSALRS